MSGIIEGQRNRGRRRLHWTANVTNLTGEKAQVGLWNSHKDEAVGVPSRMPQVAAIGLMNDEDESFEL